MKTQKGRNLITTESKMGRVTLCKLYDTVVAEMRDGSITLRHGGYITRSTVKAINAALESHGVDGKAFIKGGALYATLGGVTSEVTNV